MAAEHVQPQLKLRFSTIGALDAVQGAGSRFAQGDMFTRWQSSVPDAGQENRYAASYAGRELLGQLDAMAPHGLIAIVPEDETDTLHTLYSEKMDDSVAFSKQIRDDRVEREKRETTRVHAEIPPPLAKGPEFALPIKGDVYKQSFLNDVDPAERMHVERGYDAFGKKLEPVIVVTKATLEGFLGNDQPEIGYV